MSKKVPIHLQSSQNRLIIKGGSVVNADGVEQVDVFIEDGKIKQVGNHLIIPGGTRTIDAAGKLVIPGGVDADVRLQAPYPEGNTRSIDDFYRGTRAAVVGGTTTIVDRVVAENGESLKEAFDKWRGWADEKVCCDYALSVALDAKSVKGGALARELEELTSEEFGANVFHASMSGSEERRLADAELMEVMEAVKAVGGLLQIHAESGEIVAREEKAMLEKGITGPEGYAQAHSEMAEEEAAMRASTLANQLECPVLVGPLTGSSSLEVLERKKRRGDVIWGTTTPAAMACDGKEYFNSCWRHAAGFLCAPPLRDGQTNDIIRAVADGTAVDLLVSGHETYTAKQKALGSKDFTKIPLGVNGVESRMSVLWELAVHSGRMDPTAFVAMTSAIPAKMYNLYPKKGRIEVGSDADIVVWDPKTSYTISAKDHQLKVDFNVFEGMEVHGKAESVILQGRLAVDEGQIRVMQGVGRFLSLPPFAPYIYDKLKARSNAIDRQIPARRVERSEADMSLPTNGFNGNHSDEKEDEENSDLPPPAAPKTDAAVPAPNQHRTSFNLDQHPNVTPEVETSVTSPTPRSTVRVRAPPGGKSSGSFW